METQEVRVELSRARDAANAISARMDKGTGSESECNLPTVRG
ncbi:hypothetical protein OBE_13954, partial [human gut metagenome]